jgi:hypothetical protein
VVKVPLLTGSEACLLSIRKAEDYVILGDVFLQSAYVVYDLEHNRIAIAQASNDTSGESDIREISASTMPELSDTLPVTATIPADTAGRPSVKHVQGQSLVSSPGVRGLRSTETLVATITIGIELMMTISINLM